MAILGGFRMGVILAAATMVGAAALPGWAHEDEEPKQGAFGGGPQLFIVQAEQFQGRELSAPPLVTGGEEGYYWSPGSATPTAYWAPLQLPAGAVITNLQCFVVDTSLGNDVTIILWEKAHDLGGLPKSFPFAQLTSVGNSPGYQQPSTAVTPRTVRYVDGNLRSVYHVSAALADDTALRECRITWHRSVSPAPALATFTDVPVGHPQRTFVEALVAAGITGGCGTGNYCPDAPLTRGQMAVFLSVALGLHWPQ